MNGRVRVAHLIKGLGHGGAETLVRECVVKGDGSYEYFVGYFLPWKDALVEEIRGQGVQVACFDAGSAGAMMRRVPRVADWLRRNRIDVVHAHLPLSGVVARLAGRIVGTPVVYTEHSLQERYRWLTRQANRMTWRLQSQVIAVSEQVADSMRGRGLDYRVPTRVVRNGVDARRFAAAAPARKAVRAELGLQESAVVVGTVAGLRREKRFDLWLRAARAIRASFPDTRFVIVGDGPLRAEIEAVAQRLGIADTVRFAGMRPDPAPYFAAMDIYMSSSDYEGLPLSLLEAMAGSLPPVCTGVGGIRDVIDDGKTGFLVAPGDVESLAAAACRLVADGELRRRIGIAAQAVVDSQLGIDQMIRGVEACYADALVTARGAARPGIVRVSE